MSSLPSDVWEWLSLAEKERMAAERETDPATKEAMLEFAELYLQFAQATAAPARAKFTLAARSDPPN